MHSINQDEEFENSATDFENQEILQIDENTKIQNQSKVIYDILSDDSTSLNTNLIQSCDFELNFNSKIALQQLNIVSKAFYSKNCQSSKEMINLIDQYEKLYPKLIQKLRKQEFNNNDVINILGGSCGRFQILSSISFAILFAVGSQFFYSMPFYQLYPALMCYNENGMLIRENDNQLGGGNVYCSVDFACKQKHQNGTFQIDWKNQFSLNNWMTQLDLICEEPYKIGLMGVISFISFSFGSILFTNIIDWAGRKYVVLISSLLTPLGIFIFLVFKMNLISVYILIFLIGLTYNTRSSTAYLYAIEFMESQHKIHFGKLVFGFSGIFQCLSAVWFYYLKDQNYYFIMIFMSMVVALFYIMIFVPESPLFLIETRQFEKLKKCMENIANLNNIKDKQNKIQYCLDRIKIKSMLIQANQKLSSSDLENEEFIQSDKVEIPSIMSNPQILRNLISICCVWSMAGFVTYLLIYYSKYFKGNFYVVYAFPALSDSISMIYVDFLIKKLKSVTFIIKILIIILIVLTVFQIVLESALELPEYFMTYEIAAMIFIMRLHVCSIQNFGYHVNQLLFPVLVRGRAYGITNFVSRPFAALSTLVTEYTKNPLYYVLLFSFLSIFSIKYIKEFDQ